MRTGSKGGGWENFHVLHPGVSRGSRDLSPSTMGFLSDASHRARSPITRVPVFAASHSCVHTLVPVVTGIDHRVYTCFFLCCSC